MRKHCVIPINTYNKKNQAMLKKFLLSSFIALSLLTSAFAGIININTADITTLAENLKGIGMKKAKAIIEYRKANGNFNTIDDITNVKGIGPKTLAKNRDNMIIEDKSKATAEKLENKSSTTEEKAEKTEGKDIEKETKKETPTTKK